MRTSANPESVYAALLEVQKGLPHVTSDAVNPRFNSKYAKLANYQQAIKPLCSQHGLLVLPYVRRDEDPGSPPGTWLVCLRLIVGAEWVEVSMPIPWHEDAPASGMSVPEGVRPARSTAEARRLADQMSIQAFASALTYLMRQITRTTFNVPVDGDTEDDDGNRYEDSRQRERQPAQAPSQRERQPARAPSAAEEVASNDTLQQWLERRADFENGIRQATNPPQPPISAKDLYTLLARQYVAKVREQYPNTTVKPDEIAAKIEEAYRKGPTKLSKRLDELITSESHAASPAPAPSNPQAH